MHLLLYEFCCVQSAADPAGLALLHEGWGMLHALVEDLSRAAYHLTVLASPALESRLRTFPNVAVIHTSPDEDLEQLGRWAPRADACLIIAPEFRGLLADRVAAVLATGGRALNCSPECIRLTGNKQDLAETLPSRSPVTMRWSPCLSLRELGWTAAVLKPIDGAGSQATFVVQDDDALVRAVAEARAEGWTDLIVQPYHAGSFPASVCVLAGEHSLLLPPTEQLLSVDGRLRYRGARYPLTSDQHQAIEPAIREIQSRILPGSRGWVGVDLDLSGIVFDINPRLTTSYLALRQRCQGNLADALVRIALGEAIAPLEWDETPLEVLI